jgi:1-deoxy-D-xylulose-5-phosphate reductoisomerase
MKGISILGSTGSIGCNTLKVIEHLGDFRVVALGAGRNMQACRTDRAVQAENSFSVDNEACAEALKKS